jgi:hypothetical protein
MENNHEGFINVTQVKITTKAHVKHGEGVVSLYEMIGPLTYHGSLFDVAKTYNDYSMGMVSR